MGRGLLKVKDYFLNPCPSLFDVCAILGIAGMGFIPRCLQGFYFCFYSVLVVVMGLATKTKRNIVLPELTLLSLIALVGLFYHAFYYAPNSISFQYLNFYLMFEGFGYIFFGCLLFSTLISKGNNLRMFYLTIPVALLNTIDSFIYSGRGSVIFAMAIALIVFLIMRKMYAQAVFIIICSGAFFLVKSEWFLMKWTCRIPLWKDMLSGIRYHPFIGQGFNHMLTPDNMMVSTSWGKTWLFKHNDYLNILGVLGISAIIPIVLFIKNILYRLRASWYFVPALGICILCFVQMTIFAGDRALAIVSFLALAVTENIRS